VIISVFNDLNYQRVTRFSCLFSEDNLSQRQKTSIESEEGIEPSTHNEERPRGLESNQSRQTLILQYTAKTLYNTTLKM